jgi:hypothetical protein
MLPTRERLIELSCEAGQMAQSQVDEQSKKILKRLTEDFVDNSDIPYYMYDAPVNFSQKKASELALARSWCRMIHHLEEDNRYRQHGIDKKEQVIALATEVIRSMPMEGMKITTPGSLRKKLFYFPFGDTLQERSYLISDKYGNQNARIMGTAEFVHPETGEIMPYDVHEALMYYGFMNPFRSNKNTAKYVYENVYLPAVESLGLAPLSYRTICKYTSA